MMNRTMKLLLLSDIFVLTGFGLIQPILAIYINDGGVTGGTMLTAGLASALFMFTKSMVQLPFGHYVDRQPGKTKWLILGTLLMAICACDLRHRAKASIISIWQRSSTDLEAALLTQRGWDYGPLIWIKDRKVSSGPFTPHLPAWGRQPRVRPGPRWQAWRVFPLHSSLQDCFASWAA